MAAEVNKPACIWYNDMPTVHSSHILSQRAVREVCKILHDANALTEEIRNDYGEDLLIQTHLAGKLDSFAMLVQVKGRTLNINSDGFINIRIKKDHLLRWCRHLQPIIVCIYDFRSERTYAFIPADKFSLWNLSLDKRKYINIKLDNGDLFSQENALHIIWNSRLKYYSMMLALCMSNIDDMKILNKIVYYDNVKNDINSEFDEVKAIVIHFLYDLNIIKNGILNDEFMLLYRSNLSYGECDSEEELFSRRILSISYALSFFVKKYFTGGMPMKLHSYSVRIIEEIMTDGIQC
ncbi:DUF4365 domain-containing protein [Xanthobacter versatilis]|uniref:DUF4365 domain-containing protein n=1 Tax=Xanthobacter autotrophicus (strain ATCC BAA-1158 / Py2) TaxID=78245 RepID=UPI0037262480